MPNERLRDPFIVDPFLDRWEASGAAERANYALFLTELCDVLGVPRPEPTRPDDSENAYVIERAVPFHNPDGSTTVKRIDLYKRGCFVLEAKQGSDQAEVDPLAAPKRTRRGTAVRGSAGWDAAMVRARGQAEQYVRNLPAREPNPAFLVVVDVGHTIELYSDFTGQGRTYVAFPEARSHRIRLRDLADETIRERLRLVWTDPLRLDPSRRAAKVTRIVAERLARLAQSLEVSGHDPGNAAAFLMRCLFTFFAEDVGLLPRACFTDLLRGLRDRHEASIFPGMVHALWATMKTGGFSPILRQHVLRFNGGLFENPEALPVTESQLILLIEAGEHDWRDVEPAIFGTLLERALNPIERHNLGAHYTPRAYVERLVLPTIVEPLRERWSDVQTAALTLATEGDLGGARKQVRGFLDDLCATTILDPACGTGNFLYVSLEHLKRLEGEVWDVLRGFGETQEVLPGTGQDIDPHQLKGIELNPRAAAIADLVLWIGYLQWNLRTFGRPPAEPIIHAFRNVECRDALLAYDGTEPLRDDRGELITRWDGITSKVHTVTGEAVPDEFARIPVIRYINPSKAGWPKAEYIVGNPPFLGKLHMMSAFGPGYVEALRAAYANEVNDSADFVMYWWHKAAILAANGNARRFGFITTNSLTQAFNRRVVQHALTSPKPISLVFAIPDHPWVDTQEGAAVRIAMTVGARGNLIGELAQVVRESVAEEARDVEILTTKGIINEDLSMGTNVFSARPLRANSGLASMGPALGSRGFVVDSTRRDELLKCDARDELERRIRPLRNGEDLLYSPRGVYAIDMSGIDYEESLMSLFPTVFNHLKNHVYPSRSQNGDMRLRKYWWLFRRSNDLYRTMLAGLDRFIVTVETAKHRTFFMLDSEIQAEHGTISFGLQGHYFFGILSSRIHVTWALATGGTLEDRPRYNKTVCFEPFPLPDPSDELSTKIEKTAEHLDSHRKARQADYPSLTITGMYNVLAKLRSGESLTGKERIIHEQGLVSVLKQIHDDLDAAVFDAYGWPQNLTDEEILSRLVDLNRERSAEEARGIVRWLRPEFQNPGGARATAATQAALPILREEPESVPSAASKPAKRPWPKSLAEQAQAVRAALAGHPAGLTAEALARLFSRARADRVGDLLDTLVSLGQARELADGRYVGV